MPIVPLFGRDTGRQFATAMTANMADERAAALGIKQAALAEGRRKIDNIINMILAKREQRDQERAARKTEGGGMGSSIGTLGGAGLAAALAIPTGGLSLATLGIIGGGAGLGGAVGGLFDSGGTTPSQVGQAASGFARNVAGFDMGNPWYGGGASPHEYGIDPATGQTVFHP